MSIELARLNAEQFRALIAERRSEGFSAPMLDAATAIGLAGVLAASPRHRAGPDIS